MSERRDPLSYLAVLRGTSAYHRRSRQVRLVTALLALALVSASAHAGPAAALVLIAAAGPGLNYAMTLYHRGWFRGFRPLRAVADVTDRTDGKHQLNLPAYVELLGFVALVFVFSWVTIDLSPQLRLAGLLLAMVYTISVAQGLFGDNTWFNPAETSPPWWHELIRLVAGPTTCLIVAAVALPGGWTAAQRPTVLAIVALPLVASVRISDLDRTIAVIPGIVAEERRLGLELVVSETEHALAGTLAEIEQLTSSQRAEAPVLHELAVHARTRLGETLDSARDPRPRPLTVESLLGPVLTLARAVGVDIRVAIRADAPSGVDHETAAWVLQDLVGNAINARAAVIEVTVARSGSELVIAVADDGGPMHRNVWKNFGTSSARLEQHLISLDGSLQLQERVPGKEITARWSTGRGEEGADAKLRGQGPAR